jgi:hypothetical protein
MVGVIRLENPMMHEGVAFEWIGESGEWFVHDEAMNGPFDKGSEYHRDNGPKGHPGKKHRSQMIGGLRIRRSAY